MSAENEEEPEPKRLRSSEPDLSVTVGTGDNVKEYRYHSQVLATHSSYIDTMLATPMKESQSRQLTFPDLTPEIWELMMKVLYPVEARHLSIENAVELAPVYDKYSFEQGLKMCDEVITELFEQNCGNLFRLEKKPSHDLDLLIDAFLAANAANLNGAIEHGETYFRNALTSLDRYGRIMFSADQIKKLVPLIVEKRFLSGLVAGKRWSNEEIMNPMFPEYFVLCCKDYHTRLHGVDGLRLSGSGCGADGVFHRVLVDPGEFRSDRRILDGDDVSRTVFIGKEFNGDWVIVGEAEQENEDGEPDIKILWKIPYSSNIAFPPISGWEPVDELARGSPKIEYIFPSG